MTDLEYFKLSKPERWIRNLGRFFVNIPKKLGSGIKKLGLLIVSIFKGIGTNIADLFTTFKNGDWKTRLSYLIMGFGSCARGQWGRGILFFLFQIVEQDDVVVQVIGDIVGEEGRVFSFHARQLRVGDFQPVIPQPGQHGEQHEQHAQRCRQIVKARQRPGSRGEKVDELRSKQRQNSPGKYLVDERAGHGRVEMLLQPGNQRDRPPFEKQNYTMNFIKNVRENVFLLFFSYKS